METIDPVTIDKTREGNPSLDFLVLREQSIALLQKLSGKTWTDFNLHDPGITILEQLCYAITDLVYRTNFPIGDILSNIHGKINTHENSFFSKEEILTSNPVTVSDFRKVLLDEVEEIANVQLEPIKSAYSHDYVKGLYKIIIQVDHSTVRKFENNPRLEQDIVNKVKHVFLNHRNLSEDMMRQIVVLKPRKIYIQAKVIIQDHVLPEEILAKIYHQVEVLLCPVTKRYTEKELLDKGMSIEQIYSGPLLKYGIIPDKELKPLKKEIDPAEILKEILKVKGVMYVKDLSVDPEKNSPPGKPLELLPGEFPLLEIVFSDPGIKLFSDEYEFEVNEQLFRTAFGKYTQTGHSHRNPAEKPQKFISRGTFKDIKKYYSLQNYFPVTYGIGEEGLSVHETSLRKAQAKQLKAYLLFYEQVLANYLAQLANTSRLFSADLSDKNAYTYTFQPLYDVPGIEDLMKPFTDTLPDNKKEEWEKFKQDRTNAYRQQLKKSQETLAEYQDRKNRMFDHLLARFNQRISIYPVALYNSVYGNSNEAGRNDTLLTWKADILKNTVSNTYNRVRAFNYADKEENTSGFEKKMLTLLLIKEKENRYLSASFATETVFYSQKKDKAEETPPAAVKNEAPAEDKLLDPDLFVTAADIRKLLQEDAYTWEPDKDTNYVFRDQTISLLRYGLDLKNYKIGPDPTHAENHVIIYKEPSAKKWLTVSRHTAKVDAVKALFKLVDFLKKLSLHSEGFHIVEHVLLRPDIKNDVFGFRFFNARNAISFANDSYTSFEAREETIANILSIGTGSNTALKNIPHGSQLKVKRSGINNFYYNLKIDELKDETKYPSEKEFKTLVTGLKLFKQKKTDFFPRFEMTVKLTDLQVIKEDFFNFRMTVVFPSWPARFQDQEFKNFVKDLFIVNAPIYIRINILWLDVSAMAGFEKIYFQWLDGFQKNEPYEQFNALSEKLIGLIKDDSFTIR